MDLELSQVLVLDSNKSIDIEASVEKFRTAATLLKARHDNDLEVVANAVNAIFDKYRGANLTMEVLKSFTCTSLDVPPEAYGDICDRIYAYVQENLEAGNGITKAGKPALFGMRKGRGGGFCRLSDQKKGD